MKEYIDFSHQDWYTAEQFAELIDNSIRFIIRTTSHSQGCEDVNACELADVLGWLMHVKDLALNSLLVSTDE